MSCKIGTYDSQQSKEITLNSVKNIFRDLGVSSIYAKKLAANDNSKNQPYFGSHLSDVAFLPTQRIEASATESTKSKDPKRQIKYQAQLDLSWVDAQGRLHPAPHSKLIYYPQYPEVRISGFLKGSSVNISEWMDRYKSGTSAGRWLLLGSAADEKIIAYFVTPECNLSKELEDTELVQISSIFSQIKTDTQLVAKTSSTRDALLSKLLDIHNMGWIPSQKMNSDKTIGVYTAPNGGGYTLEAVLEVTPNGFAAPDYLGWEVKQFSVSRYPRVGAKPTTLFTPEPDGGMYVDEGAIAFVRKYGYPAKSGQANRLNFGGIHVGYTTHSSTNLTLQLDGFDATTKSITEATGSIVLLDKSDKVTASWSFSKLMGHWKKKHSQAVYIPCLKRKTPSGIEYQYGKDIELGVGTTFEMILSSIAQGDVYYDPGIKLENNHATSPVLKRRSQFRVKHKHLDSLYKQYESIDTTIQS